MPREYSRERFLLQVPEMLIRQFIASVENSGDYGHGDALPDGADGTVADYLDTAPPEIRDAVDSTFREVEEYASTGLVDSVIERAQPSLDGPSLADQFDAMNGDEERLLWTLLHCPELYAEAVTLDHAKSLSSYRLRDGVECNACLGDLESAERFGAGISEHFRKRTAGKRFQVTCYEQGGEYYYCCSLEARAQRVPEFAEDNRIRAIPRKGILDVVVAYDPVGKVLRTHAKGGAAAQNAVDAIFGREVLRVDLSGPPVLRSSVDLSSLSSEREFLVGAEPLVESVVLREIKLISAGGISGALRISVPAGDDSDAVWDMMTEALGRTDVSGIWKVVSAKFLAKVRLSNDRVGSRVFTLSVPRYCSVANDAADKAVLRLLQTWGLYHAGTSGAGSGAD